MKKVDIGNEHIFRADCLIYMGQYTIRVRLFALDRDEPNGTTFIDWTEKVTDSIDRQSLESILEEMMEAMAKKHGLTPKQQEEVEIFKEVSNELDAMYPIPAIPPKRKKGWWK